jgi:Dyp-type peroxidase family
MIPIDVVSARPLAGARAPTEMPARGLHLDQIQGNIVGFQKDYQAFLFLRFPDGQRDVVRDWLGGLVPQVATAREVLAFNSLYKALRDRRDREDTIKATWLNIAFTYRGLEALGAPDLQDFPREFEDGMGTRAGLLGDKGESAPGNWVVPRLGKEVHALLLLAADDRGDLEREVARQLDTLQRALGLRDLRDVLLHEQYGADLATYDGVEAQRGHEHFGYKDGVSQPVRTDDWLAPAGARPRAGSVAPDEFVVGYSDPPGLFNLHPNGADDKHGPAWTQYGSYLVFRRLRQKVGAFRAFLRAQAAEFGLSERELRAKLVGRYTDGTPRARTRTRGSLNDFGYAEDPTGEDVPRAAHIRKVNPRDQDFPGQAVVDKARLLRRGIPYGEPYREGEADDDHDRGLLFLGYQRSIAAQFEVVQARWANQADFPRGEPAPGHDPIIGQPEEAREFRIPGVGKEHLPGLEPWVVTTGGDYFFSPSISALHILAGNEGEGGPALGRNSQEETGMVAQEHDASLLGRNRYRGSGSCAVTINVAIADLQPDHPNGGPPRYRRYKWEVVIGEGAEEETVWRSNEFTELRVNSQGIAIGHAEVSVRRILEVLLRVDADISVRGILNRATPEYLEQHPDEADKFYRSFSLVVWINDDESIRLPIDMTITPP